MHEFSRVMLNRRTLLFLLLLLFFNVTFCLYQCNDSKEITPTGQELLEYLEEYPEYVKRTQQNVELMQGVALFEDNNSFARKNIRKTAEDYQRLEGISLTFGENRGVVVYSRFGLTNFLLLAAAVFLVLRFTEEQKKGLHLLIRTTVRGRIPLLLERVGILCFGMCVFACLLYGSTLAVVSVLYPGADLGRTIQSVPEFMKCGYPISIGEYLLNDILFKAVAGVLAGMLLLTLSAVLPSGVAMAGFLLLMSLEYLFYLTIVPTSSFANLKFINICALLFGRDAYTGYLNLNFFGRPVLMGKLQLSLLLLLFAVMTAICLTACAKNRRQSFELLTRLMERLSAWYSRHRRCPGVLVWEARKILIRQKGLLILFLAGYLAYSASLESCYIDLRNPYEMMWYEKYDGPLSQEKVGDMETELGEMEQRREKLLEDCDRLQEKIRANYGNPDFCRKLEEELSKKEKEAEELREMIAGLSKVQAQAVSGVEYMEQTGKQLWLLEPYTYHLLLKNDVKTYQRNRWYVLVAVIGAFSGCMAYENKYHTESTMHTLYRGRRTVLYKILIVTVFSAATALCIHMIQFIQIGKEFAYHAMDHPVQSIECMRQFPLDVTIRGYLCLLYGWRCLYAAAAGLVVMGIGYLSKDRVTCLAASVAALLLPVFLVFHL